MAESLEERFEAAVLADRLARAQIPRTAVAPGAVSLLARGITIFGSGFSQGLADVVGLPVDATNAALRAVGVPTSDVPLLGSESIKRVMRRVGLITDAPTGPAGRIVERIGEEVGAAAVPTGTALGLARRGIATGSVLLRPFVEQPARAVTTEAALALGGGTGAGTAREVFPGSPVAEVAGTIGGSLATGLPIAATQRVVQTGRRLVEPFTRSGVERRAATGLQASTARPIEQVAEDLRRGVEAVRGPLGIIPTTAQAAGDPGLLALERSLSRRSPQAKGELEDIVLAERRAVRRAAEEIVPAGRPEAVREALEAQKRQAEQAGAAAITRAEERVRAALSQRQDPLEANRVIRQSLAEAETTAQEQARALFRQVGDVRGPVDRLRAKAAEIRRGARKVERPDDMPDVVGVVLRLGRKPRAGGSILGPTGQPVARSVTGTAPVPIDEMMALRSRISQDVREELAKAAPNRLRISRLEQLKDAVDDTITQDFGDAGPLYEEARQFFRREVADRFRRGTVAEVLRVGALGEPGRLPMSGIINRFFRAGRGAREAAQDFNRVLSSDQAARTALREGALQQFADFAVRPDGTFDVNRARQWAGRFKQALREFPDIASEVRRITQLGDEAAHVRIGVEKTLQRFQDAGLRFFLEADPDRAVKAVLGSRNPTEALRTLVQAVRPHSEALQGLRGAVWAQALEQAGTRSFDEAIANVFLSPGRMRQFLQTHRRTFVSSGLYTSDELRRIDAVVRAAEIVDRSVSVGVTGGSDTAANLQGLKSLTGLTMPGLWSRFYAIARGVVSPRFILTEIGSRVGKRIVDKISDEKVTALTVQALKDPEVARTLLMRDTAVPPLLVSRRLHGHLVNLGPVTLGTGERRRDEAVAR